MSITIRPWQRDDLPSIRKVIWQSWISTYSPFIPERDLKLYFETNYAEASLLGMFGDPFTRGFVAQIGDHIAGYARLFFDQAENRLYVSSLYLLPEFQGQGIGVKLLEAAERYAVEKGEDDLWIGVMVQNTQALHFYRKAGFVFVREEPFIMGSTTVAHLIGYMNLGRRTLLREKTYASFAGETTAGSLTSAGACHGSNTGREKGLAERCLRLLSEQKRSWRNLREGCESLAYTREREVPCSGFSVRLQYNPGRIKSSTADVDAGKINERRCFLCLDQLPEGQKGILYRGEFLILCNPMPVFLSHFTIPHVDHRRQAIADHVKTFLHLMADLGCGWTVLYNGPRCGASAPDHLHFQAGPSEQMPIGKEILEEKRLSPVRQFGDMLLYRVRNLGREVLILEGDNPTSLECVFKIFMKALQQVLLTDEEPLLNMAGFFSERSGWRLVIFPRRKHRPDVFYQEGNSRRVISPGVIDMGGLLITPVKKDFEELDAPAVEGIFREVSLDGEVIERAIETMGGMEHGTLE